MSTDILNHIEIQGKNPEDGSITLDNDIPTHTTEGLNFQAGYAGRCVMKLLHIAKRDTKMKEMMETNKQNGIHSNKIYEGMKTLTTGRLYQSREVVLGREYLHHVKKTRIDKETNLRALLDTHKKSYCKKKANITKILEKYKKI